MIISRDGEPVLVSFEVEYDRFDEQEYPVAPAIIVETGEEIELSQQEWDKAYDIIPKNNTNWLFDNNFLEKY